MQLLITYFYKIQKNGIRVTKIKGYVTRNEEKQWIAIRDHVPTSTTNTTVL